MGETDELLDPNDEADAPELFDAPDTPALPGETRPRYACALSGKPMRRRDLTRLGDVRPELAERIRTQHPDLDGEALISRDALAVERAGLVEAILRDEHGEITDLERQVIESLARQEVVSENVEDDFEEKRSFAERASDALASFGGSWRFIICFGAFMAAWMTLNVAMGKRAFDIYPFILLNLILSCLAAIQAPIIMMSQKRQEQKDRLRSLNDYRVNLKAELEIRHLHEKMDHLVKRQWERLAAIQRIQIELLEELAGKPKKPRLGPPTQV